MKSQSETGIARRLSVFTSTASICSIVIGLSVLAGWRLNVPILLTWGGGTTMAPNAAACSLLAGISLWLVRSKNAQTAARKMFANAAAAIVGLVGLLTLAEQVFAVDLGIDSLLVAAPVALDIVGARIRMSPVAAIIFLLFALALGLIDWRTRRNDWPAQFLSLATALAAVFGALSFVFGPKASSIPVALPAVGAYVGLAFGALCARPQWAIGGLLISDTQGAKFLRKVVPASLLALALIGWIISKPLLTEEHFTWIEVSALALFSSALLGAFTAWIAFILDRGDAERRKLEQALNVSQETIDQLLDRIEEPPAEKKLRAKVRAGFAFAIVLTSLLGLLSWRMARQSAADAAWVAHTHEVSTAIEATLRHLVDIETGARGFALTGNIPFLEPYETGKSAIALDLRRLRRLLADNVDQTRRLNELEAQINVRMAAATDVVISRQNNGKLPTAPQLAQGKHLMDAVRATVAEMEDAEERLLEQRLQRAHATQHFNLAVIVLASILGLILLVVAGATVSREIGIAARARAQVETLNANLERSVAERTAALGESEGRLAGVIQSAMDAIITVDEDQRIVLFNCAAERIFLCPRAEALGQPVARFIPQRFHAAHAGSIREFGETNVTNRALMGPKNVLWALRADGHEFQIEASISQVVTRDKKLFTVILRDVTERVRADALREHLAAVVNSSDDAIISKDLEGKITAWNHGAERIFGYTAAQAIGQPMQMLFPPDRIDEEAGILASIRCGESVEHFETRRIRKDGKSIDVSVTISPIRDNSGAVIGASKIARDITERKHAEQALREQAQMLDLAQVLVRDIQGRIILWNRGAENLYGFTKQEAEGRVSHELLHTEFPEPLARIEEQLHRTGSWEGELVHLKRDTTRIVVYSLWVLHRDKYGNPLRILEAHNDITARKQVEGALRDSEEKLRLVIDGARLGTWHWKIAADELEGSPLSFALFGLPPDTKFTFPLFLARLHPEDRPLVDEAMRRSLAGQSIYDIEYRTVWPDGTERWIAAKGKVYQNAAGENTYMGGILFDITDRRRSEQKLARQKEELSRQAVELAESRQALETQTLMLQSVLDSIEEGLVVADEHGKFIIWNPAARRILGLEAASVPTAEWPRHYGLFREDMVTPFPPDELPLLKAIRGTSSSAEMFVCNAAMEKGNWIEVTGSPLKDRNSEVHGGVVAFRDITQKKAAEMQIRKLNQSLEQRIAERTAQLETVNRDLEAFTYSVSHDLRAPLRHILGFGGAFLEEFGAAIDPRALHYWQRIQDGTRRMSLLIEELLTLSRTGQRSLHLELTELNPIVEEIILMLKAETEGREVEWKIGSLPPLECDPVLIRQVFQNLLSNAIKYSRPRPHAVIEIGNTEIGDTQENGWPVIFVRDNGVGFDMRYADKLFGVFQRLHREEDFEGTGVGLATVHRIVQKHGGRIWVEAQLDQGATFYFTLGSHQSAGSPGNKAMAGGAS
ncbi:MAG: PAS domain S-box protein [Terriglobales bacterium]